MEKNITMWLLYGTQTKGNSVRPSGGIAAVPGRSLNIFASRKWPRNTNKLGMQMQNPKSIFTSNKSPAVLQLTAMRVRTRYGMEWLCTYNCQEKKKKPVNRSEELVWGKREERPQCLLDRLEWFLTTEPPKSKLVPHSYGRISTETWVSAVMNST